MNFRKYLTILIVPLTFILFSCGNMFNSQSKNIDSAQTKAYFSVKVSKISSNRTINHDDMYESDSTLIQALEDFSLTGKYQNEDNDNELLTAQTAAQLAEKVIEIDAGNWEFTLSAKYKGLIYKATKTVSIEQGKNNTASFILKPEEDVGGYQISYTMTATPISMVKATLTKADGSGTPIIQTITADAFETEYASSRRYAVFKRDISNSAERMETGSYSMLVEFFADQNDVPVNTREDYLYIQAGRMTYAVIAVDFNEVFSIDYKDESGNLLSTDDFESGIIITKYSIRSEFNLPRPKASNKIFMGWKEMDSSGDFSSTYTNKIQKSTTGNKVFVADFEDTVLYVSGTGYDNIEPDEHGNFGDGSVAHPFESIDKACEKIIELGNPDLNWTIYIDGDVTGPHSGTRKAGSRNYSSDYGRSIIPVEITQEHAKSILLKGKNDPGETAGVPNAPTDMINRGLSSSSNSDTGSVLVIATAVPVKVENLLIKNGCNKPANSSSDPYSEKGGGLFIASEATVTLGDGVIISNNNAKTAGGGIYNEGTLFINGSAIITSNTCDDGGGIYNSGKLYLGFEEETTPKEWTGSIDHNNSWRGAGIKNTDTGVLVMDSGCIKYNSNASNSNTYGGGVYNMGSFTMTGGVIEFNNCCHGGGVYVGYDSATKYGTFTFSDGIIRNNFASYAYGAPGDGGGIYNNGLTYIYGDAVIGDDSASGTPTDNTISTSINITETAISTSCSNLALGNGGGIYVSDKGKLYLGYSNYVDATENTPAPWNKGIYYNHAHDSGGGLYFVYGNNVAINMNSGTISNNGAAKSGGAICVCGDGTLTLGGTTTIPAGEGEIKQSIAYSSAYPIIIADTLEKVTKGSIYLIPAYETNSSSNKLGYSSYKPLISLTDEASAAGITINDIKEKFIVEPFTDPLTGIVTNWTIGSDGKVAKCIENLTVSATGTYQSIADAVATMNDASKDYIITLDGEITGAQTIEGLSGEEIKANSITIKGKASSSSNLSDIINASGGTGSALSINTRVPVTFSYIAIKGGCAVNGGGLFLGEGATAYLTNYTTIKENTNYSEGVNTEGKGGGVYISNEAKMIMNSVSTVCDNTGTRYGAGIYVEDGGYLRMLENSESHVSYNKFISGSDQVMGGGIYLEDGAVMEHEGGYIHDNEVNADGLATGVYVNSSAIYKTMRYARLTYQNDNVPNDIYLAGDAKIELLYAMYYANSYIRRITLQNYEENKELFTLASGVSSTITYMDYFDVTSQTLTGGQKQYWAIEKNTGKLIKSSGMGITVSIPSGNDIEVTVNVFEGELVTPLEPGTHFTGGSKLVFTVADQTNYDDFIWTVDGDENNAEYNSSFVFDTSGYSKGVYVIYLEAKDSAGKYYSYTAQVKVE